MTKTIQLHHHQFQLLLPQKEILEAIHKMAEKMTQDFEREKPVFLVVLKGAFMFATELIKAVDRDCDIEFIRIKSYEGMDNSGGVKKEIHQTLHLEGRTVVILEDIVDTGQTLEYLDEELKRQGAKKVLCATLFLKPEAYKKSRKIDYVGLEIPNQFVVGFGLDYNESGRGFPDLYSKIDD